MFETRLLRKQKLIVTESLSYVTRKQWVAQPPLDKLENLTLPVKNVVITETDSTSCDERGDCTKRVRFIQMLDIESLHHCDIDYNFLVSSFGEVYIGRGWNSVGSHTKGCYKDSICIALIGEFNFTEPQELQIDSVKTLIEVGIILEAIDPQYNLYGQFQIINSTKELLPKTKLFNIIKTWSHWKSSFNDSTFEFPNNTNKSSSICEIM